MSVPGIPVRGNLTWDCSMKTSLHDQTPAHGIVEVKPVSDELMNTARSEKVERYVKHYSQALVTRDLQTGKAIIKEVMKSI